MTEEEDAETQRLEEIRSVLYHHWGNRLLGLRSAVHTISQAANKGLWTDERRLDQLRRSAALAEALVTEWQLEMDLHSILRRHSGSNAKKLMESVAVAELAQSAARLARNMSHSSGAGITLRFEGTVRPAQFWRGDMMVVLLGILMSGELWQRGEAISMLVSERSGRVLVEFRQRAGGRTTVTMAGAKGAFTRSIHSLAADEIQSIADTYGGGFSVGLEGGDVVATLSCVVAAEER